MSDSGYTLTEMLAALIMIGLAVGGLTQGLHVIGLAQGGAARAIGEARAVRAAEQSLDRLLDRQGPFFSDGGTAFKGSASGFDFSCGTPKRCAATIGGSPSGYALSVNTVGGTSTLNLPASVGELTFVYGGAMGAAEQWPPTKSSVQALQWVGLKRHGGADATPIAEVRLWTEQPRNCAFDVIAQRCRDAAP